MNLHREIERLRTFTNWPLEWLDCKLLAACGFYYTGSYDKVVCHFCVVEIGRWEETDDVMNEHFRWSPNCPLINDMQTSNVPLDGGKQLELLSSDTKCRVRQFHFKENVLVTHKTPHKYLSEMGRFESFSKSKRVLLVHPRKLAVAGFVMDDNFTIRCFCCNVRISETDMEKCRYDPMNEHKENCKFISGEYNLQAGEGMEECKICYDHKCNTAFLTCGHVVACVKCAKNVTKCPVCAQTHSGILRIYFS